MKSLGLTRRGIKSKSTAPKADALTTWPSELLQKEIILGYFGLVCSFVQQTNIAKKIMVLTIHNFPNLCIFATTNTGHHVQQRNTSQKSMNSSRRQTGRGEAKGTHAS